MFIDREQEHNGLYYFVSNQLDVQVVLLLMIYIAARSSLQNLKKLVRNLSNVSPLNVSHMN